MVGSIIPSSNTMIKALLAPVDWENCELFVEYGPGVGTMTSHILERLPARGKLLAIDTNARFIDYLSDAVDDPRLHPVLGSAADVGAMVEELGHTHADCILSGLPFSGLSPELGQEIVTQSRDALRVGGAFITYQLRSNARDITEANFSKVEQDSCWWNFPPCMLTWGWKTGAD